MDINTLQEDQYVDLFSNAAGTGGDVKTPLRFGSNNTDVDILDVAPSSTTDTTTTIPEGSTTDTTTSVAEPSSSTTDTTTLDTDIIGDGRQAPPKKGKYEDASGYFSDRIKSGKFVAIKETLEDGSESDFIPKTPEDFDEVIDIQVNYQLEKKQKDLEERWYQSKSPAWQAVAKYAELTDDPAEILPFIEGVRTLDSVKNFDENELEGAEQIVRTRLQQRGDAEDVIAETIDSLKTTDKLISTAKKYKPVILQQEQVHLQQMIQEKRKQDEEYQNLIMDIRKNAMTAIEAPIFGKQKLKQEEKAVIYELIGEPNVQTKGYGIYNAIDDLFDKGDFETLKQIALLVSKKDAFLGYVTTGAADKAAETLQRKLRIATESRSSSTNDPDVQDGGRKTVQRSQYSSPRFGR